MAHKSFILVSKANFRRRTTNMLKQFKGAAHKYVVDCLVSTEDAIKQHWHRALELHWLFT